MQELSRIEINNTSFLLKPEGDDYINLILDEGLEPKIIESKSDMNRSDIEALFMFFEDADSGEMVNEFVDKGFRFVVRNFRQGKDDDNVQYNLIVGKFDDEDDYEQGKVAAPHWPMARYEELDFNEFLKGIRSAIKTFYPELWTNEDSDPLDKIPKDIDFEKQLGVNFTDPTLDDAKVNYEVKEKEDIDIDTESGNLSITININMKK